VLVDFPDIEIEWVDVLAEPERMLATGLRRHPALVAGEKSVNGLFLTRRRIRKFLQNL